MAELNRTNLLAYVVCAGASIWGLALAFGVGDSEEDAQEQAGPAGVVKAVPFDRDPGGTEFTNADGVTGTRRPQQPGADGEAQVKLHTNPYQRTPALRPAPKELDPLESANRDMRGRDEQLRKVIEDMGGEPVYVEGLDGPAPEKPRKKR